MSEHESVIAYFELTNEGLRLRRRDASPQIAEHCDRHISSNTRTIESMRDGLEMWRRQLKQAEKSEMLVDSLGHAIGRRY